MAAFTLLPMLACGGCLLEYALRPQSASAKAVEERNAAAREFAMPHLERHGIVSLNDDAISLAVESEREILLIATGLDASGKRHDIQVFIRGLETESKANWQLRRIDMDGQIGVNDDE